MTGKILLRTGFLYEGADKIARFVQVSGDNPKFDVFLDVCEPCWCTTGSSDSLPTEMTRNSIHDSGNSDSTPTGFCEWQENFSDVCVGCNFSHFPNPETLDDACRNRSSSAINKAMWKSTGGSPPCYIYALY